MRRVDERAERAFDGAQHDPHPPAEEALEWAFPAPPPGVFHGIVGCSPASARIVEQITRLSACSSAVLIVGETGTGKELIARALHSAGPRRHGPFVAINCAALPRDLIESELFGFKRGAFSGAVADHLGLFRAAAGGTLLLDEITEMGAELQAKLLRVVQDMMVRPVGSVVEEALDVRVVASTNRDPTSALRCGGLRSDLYYRLSVGMIAVPPLRERRDDIAPLVAYQLNALNARYQTALGSRGVTPDAIRSLRAAPWMGNVRELFNVLENAFTSCRSADLDVHDLGLPVAPVEVGRSVPPAAQTFAQGERALIERALTSTGGNKRRAAQLLGISRKKLYAKIAKYARPE